VQRLALAAGAIGAAAGYGLQYWVNISAHPLNIGGRPLNSVPSFIPVTFELTILLAALATAFGMLALNGLPRLNHPVFNVPAFVRRGSSHGFFLSTERRDPAFGPEARRRLLASLGATEVHDAAS